MVERAALSKLATSFRRPLLTIESLMIITDSTEAEILTAIENGVLPFAFDLRSGASRRRCLRIYAGTADRFEGVFASVFPGQGEAIPAARIARRLTCSNSHVHNLLAEGLLRLRPGRLRAKETPGVYRKSVFEFLSERRCR